jgi:hypothetical protein
LSSRAPGVQKEFYVDLAIKIEINCVYMTTSEENLNRMAIADAIMKATDSDEKL